MMLKLQDEYPQYEFKDLDDFGDGAATELGWPKDWQSKGWSQEKQDLRDQTANKQIYQFVQNSLKPVVFFGIHHDSLEGQQPSEAFLFRPQHKIILDIPPEVCAERKFNRDRKRASVQPDGTIYFAASGVIINPTDREQRVPPILAELRDAQGTIVYSWTIKPPVRVLPPNEKINFSEAKLDIPRRATELTVSWALPKG